MMVQDVTIVKNQVQVEISGSIYKEEAGEILENIIGFIDKGYTSFLVDLSAVDYIDSSGLVALIDAQNRVRVHDGGVVVKGLNGIVKDMFELPHEEKVLAIE